MSRITDLSVELIARILELSDWAAQLNLALSCRHLAHYTHDTLAHHRKCHALYKATSDISPRTLFDAVRALVYDPIAISHILALEFWTERSTWDAWKLGAVRLSGGKEGELADVEDSMNAIQNTQFSFEQRELNALQRLMQRELSFSTDQSIYWRHKIEAGDDGALKGLLIALSPNLEAVRFVRYENPEAEKSHANDEEEILHRYHQSCLEFVAAAIKAQCEDNAWCPGFESVSRVAVGIPSRAAFKGTKFQIFSHQTLPLFRLPNLQSLYLNGISVTEEEEDELNDADCVFSDSLPPGSSPKLQELVIEDANLGGHGQASPNLLETMMQASKSLRHIAFQNGDISSFDLDRILPVQESKVRSFLLYGDIVVNGYRSEMFYPDEVWLPPVCTVDVSDIMLCAPWTEGKGGPGNGLDPKVDMVGRWGTSRSQLAEYISDAYGHCFLYDAIVLVGDPTEEEADMIDEALASLLFSDVSDDDAGSDDEDESDEVENHEIDEHMEDGDEEAPAGSVSDEEGDTGEEKTSACDDEEYHPTSTIYLEGIDGTSLQTKRWYRKTIEAGRKSGVAVYTRTTPAPREHRFPFPWPASDKELQTSPFYRHPDLDRYLLKPHDGLVMDGCGNCGWCTACLKVMDAASWAKFREEEQEFVGIQ